MEMVFLVISRNATKYTMPSRRKRSSTKRRYDIRDDELPSNDVDEFMDARDHVKLSAQRRHGRDDGDGTDEEALEADLQDALALAMGSDYDDDDNDDDESEEDYEEEFEDGDGDALSDGDGEERRERAIKDEDDIASAWGSRKHMYYNSEAADFEEAEDEDDVEQAQEEEEEARRLQKLMFEGIAMTSSLLHRGDGDGDRDFDGMGMVMVMVMVMLLQVKKTKIMARMSWMSWWWKRRSAVLQVNERSCWGWKKISRPLISNSNRKVTEMMMLMVMVRMWKWSRKRRQH